MKKPFAIGDILITKKLGLIDHEGVYLGSNTVATNTPEKGEHITTVEEFSAGKPLKVKSTGANWLSVLENARRILSRPKPYNVAFRNCEHTASEIALGKPESRTIAAVVFFAVIGLVFAASRR